MRDVHSGVLNQRGDDEGIGNSDLGLSSGRRTEYTTEVSKQEDVETEIHGGANNPTRGAIITSNIQEKRKLFTPARNALAYIDPNES